jgi:hypothetical protein
VVLLGEMDTENAMMQHWGRENRRGKQGKKGGILLKVAFFLKKMAIYTATSCH